ncbi:tRNA uridine(34) 5-carboxymethylaminomethyl modification radical SAM/GNAT enzyme Elp3 [Candidatus Woesearchaeota archaeon]|nr:tRNA uridine(34) 5-carboxymethylaminomethyl modification radical SAM/GNAT enzyme Elp3 [Candidatus Woesearchaeota archaeon]
MKEFFSELIEEIKKEKPDKDKLGRIKSRLCQKHGLKSIPTDIEILINSKKEDVRFLRKFLRTKPTRTISGVAICAIMTRPYKCPHGKCMMCPGGPESFFGNIPQSYTGKEPATMRAIRNNYDPYLQVMNRLEQYVVLGHSIDKIELIIMGGTFPSFPKKYQENFIKYSFKAFNDFSSMFFRKNEFDFIKFKRFFELPGAFGDKKREKKIHKKLLSLKTKAKLELEQRRNEKSRARVVALCIETRPDYCKEEHIKQMLKLGTTRVELGVQTTDDDILERINRGHGAKESIIATRLLKDSLLKVGYHLMPGLPGSSIKKDIGMFKEIFVDEKFRPDAIKIYPCMVMPGTKLYEEYRKGAFKPLSTEEAARLIAKVKRIVPPYVRIMRVQRDIPTKVTSAGVDKTNLRQYVDKVMREERIKCNCIRCREPKGKGIDYSKIKLKRTDYDASGGYEVFLSIESKDVLLGFLRLRIGKNICGIRELHVYGPSIEIGRRGIIQHKGYGKMLLKEAERIAREEFHENKMLVIAGIGAREYYRKQGYKRKGCYMVKKLC